MDSGLITALGGILVLLVIVVFILDLAWTIILRRLPEYIPEPDPDETLMEESDEQR